MQIEAWHASTTEPVAGTRLKRPAGVVLIVSTGPPKRLVPSLDGLDAAGVEQALRDAGFAPRIDEEASDEEPGTVVSVTPEPGTRVPLGSTIVVVVARRPEWQSESDVESTEDSGEQTVWIPTGSRLVIETTDTSPGHGGKVDVAWIGDETGATKLRGGESVVLVDPSDHDRTITVRVDVKGGTHWRLAVEAPG
jgi:beta-lactam-binding protein with PASTA domain